MDRQPRVTDLIPRKHTSFLLLFLAGLCIVAGLETLYAWMPEIGKHATDGRIAAIDLDGEGGLAVCFSACTLMLAGLTALLIYSIRQHKEDDYDGRYRIWRWAAACWLLMALDEGASLHEGFKEMMTHTTGQRLAGDGSLWWVLAYMLLLGYVGVRLLLEMRACRGSMAAMFACATCYATAVVVQLEWVWPEAGARGVMLEEGCEMIGNLFLLLGMGLHARHVIWEATGELPPRAVRVPKVRKAKVAAAEPVATPDPAPAKPKAKVVATPSEEAVPARPRRNWLSWIWKRKAKVKTEGEGEPAKPRPVKAVDKRKVATPTVTAATPASVAAKPTPAAISKAPARVEVTNDDDDSPGDEQYRYDDAEELGENGRKMTRAERKALRRQRREQV